MCPHEPAPETNGADAEMIPVDLGQAVKTNDGPKHGEKKGFYSRPSDFLSNTSNWKVSTLFVPLSPLGVLPSGWRWSPARSVTVIGCDSPGGPNMVHAACHGPRAPALGSICTLQSLLVTLPRSTSADGPSGV